MKLIEALVQLSENYIDLRRYGLDVFHQEMERIYSRSLSSDTVNGLMKDYIKRFWKIADMGMLPGDMPNIEYWTAKIKSNPQFMKDWILFVDRNG